MKSRIGIFGITPIALLQEKRITSRELRAYIALSSYQGSNETAWPTLDQIGERSGLHPVHVSRAMQSLKKRGWVLVTQRGKGLSNVYSCLHDLADSANSDLANMAKPELANMAKSRISHIGQDHSTRTIEKNNRKEQLLAPSKEVACKSTERKYEQGYQETIKEALLKLNSEMDFKKNAKQYAIAINKLMDKFGSVKGVINHIHNAYWNDWWMERREKITPFVLLNKADQFPEPSQERVFHWGIYEAV